MHKLEWLAHVARETDLSPISVRVAVILADSFNRKTGVCNPSKRYISEQLGKSERTIQRAIQDLKNADLIKTEEGQTGRGYTQYFTLKKGDKFVSHIDQLRETDLTEGRQKSARRETKPGIASNEGTRKNQITSRKSFSDDDMQCAECIYLLIKNINPNHSKPNLEAWAETIRLMRERDKRTHEEIAELFRWANNDSFWKTNILSPEKLRKQWDTLTIKRGAKTRRNGVNRQGVSV